MRTALCLGGGETLLDDILSLPIQYDGVIACNDAGCVWPLKLDAWCSLHGGKLNPWAMVRRASGFPPAKKMVDRNSFFRGQAGSGSSGMFAAKVALVDLGFDRAVLCGIPMTPSGHFFDPKDWQGFKGHRHSWLTLPAEWRYRMRSMSGWTRVLLGHPKDDLRNETEQDGLLAPWINGSHQQDEPHDTAALAAQIKAGIERRRGAHS